MNKGPGLVRVCDPSQGRRSPFIIEGADESCDGGRGEGMRGTSGSRGAVMMEKVLTGWREGEVGGGEGRGRGDICNIWKKLRSKLNQPELQVQTWNVS